MDEYDNWSKTIQAMEPAEMSFTIMKYLGVYRPTSWSSKWAIRVYNIYKCSILTNNSIFGLTFLISILTDFHDTDLIAENIFACTTILLISLKNTHISVYREDFISFKNMFLHSKCMPRDIHEMAIRMKANETERSSSRMFFILALVTCAFFLGGPLTKGKHVTLPVNSWVPYKIDSRSVFWITYIYQSSSLLLATFMFIANETLASVMMQQICAQLEINMYRLMKIPIMSKQNNFQVDIDRQESDLVQDCIAHHNHLLKIEIKLNDLFGFIVFVQFFTTTINLCSVIYQLSKISVSTLKFFTVISILGCYIMQIFSYCWYGNLMIEKSSAIADSVYKMNWTKLAKRTKKNLIMIMLRARRPIQLSGASMVTMSVDTFLKILKTSYTTFNLLVSL